MGITVLPVFAFFDTCPLISIENVPSYTGISVVPAKENCLSFGAGNTGLSKVMFDVFSI